jgi:hypothetical protein
MELADQVLDGKEVTNEEARKIAAIALNLLFRQHRLILTEW